MDKQSRLIALCISISFVPGLIAFSVTSIRILESKIIYKNKLIIKIGEKAILITLYLNNQVFIRKVQHVQHARLYFEYSTIF